MKDIRIIITLSKDLVRALSSKCPKCAIKSKKAMTMKVVMVAVLSMFVLACSEKKDEVFSLEEANKCLLESDKNAVRDAVEWIKKAEAMEDEKKSVEYFGKAYDPIIDAAKKYSDFSAEI